jgi:SHS2 domain-containing protein
MATAMFELVDAQPDPHAPGEWREVSVDSFDPESLMVDWLGELLYLYETTERVVAAAEVTEWTPTRLTARVELRPSSAAPAMHIKAVTYHQLQVVEEEDGWMAQVYFDI